MERKITLMNNYEGIIFDLDGVICSTDKYHYAAWKQLVDQLDIYFDEKINNRLRGVARMASLEIILEKAKKEYSQEEKKQFCETKNELYKSLLANMNHSDLSEEVKGTLDTLRRTGLRLAIGSSSQNAKYILKQIGLEHYFDAISDGTNITKSKPNPEVFLKAAEFLGLNPSKCLVVEDAMAGIDAAVAGGFDSAGIGEAAGHPEVTLKLNHFADLLQVVKEVDVI